jgi:hypothetical protein
VKILKYEPERVVTQGVCSWIVYRVTLEDESTYEYYAPLSGEAEPVWKPVS